MTTLRRVAHQLSRDRRVAVVLMAIESALVVFEKITGYDPVPDIFDLIISFVAFGVLVTVFAVERLERRLSVVLAADAEDLAARRRVDADESGRARHLRERIENVLEGHDYPSMVYQPIVDVHTGQTVGFEALSRFGPGTPDVWFADAAAVGLGVALELKAVRRALDQLDDLPGDNPYLSVNCSPAVLLTEELLDLLTHHDARRVVIELTEHVEINDYERCRVALARLRPLGARLAIDDLGAGYASLRHVTELQPEIIKLDRSLANVTDASVRTMVQTLVNLGRLTGAIILAEGIENAQTLALVRDLGVDLVQGWHTGRPQPMPHLDRTEHAPQAATVDAR